MCRRPATGTRTLFAFTESTINDAGVRRRRISRPRFTLRVNAHNYLIVSHPDFLTQMAPLAHTARSQGLSGRGRLDRRRVRRVRLRRAIAARAEGLPEPGAVDLDRAAALRRAGRRRDVRSARLRRPRLRRLRADQARRHERDRVGDRVGRLVRRRQRRWPARTSRSAACRVRTAGPGDRPSSASSPPTTPSPPATWATSLTLVTDTDDPTVRFRASSAALATRRASQLHDAPPRSRRARRRRAANGSVRSRSTRVS